MKVYLIVFIVFCGMFLVSCDDILFEHPQPSWVTKNESSFPESIRGIYICQNDTIIINANSVSSYHPGKNDIIYTISDSLILRIDKDTCYWNMRIDEFWDIIIGKIKGDSLFRFTLNGNDEEVRHAIEKITHLNKINADSSNYVINPAPSEFKEILGNNLFKQDNKVYVRLSDK